MYHIVIIYYDGHITYVYIYTYIYIMNIIFG